MHALGMSDHRWRPAPPPRTPGAQQPAAHHKLGFADSERIPVILEPQKLYDAFQDIARTGPLPYNLSKGSLPVYFPMNHKFIGEYMHKVFYPPEKKQAWELTASRQGPFGGAHEAQHGRALVLDTSQPANSPALEDRRGGQDYLGTFMTERRHFDGTVTRLSSPAHTVTRLSSPAHTVTRVQPGSHGDAFVSPGSEHTTGFDTAGRPWQSQGAQILRIHTSDVSQDGRPATAASALGTERARGKTHNAHAFDPTPIGSHDKVLREKRTDYFEVPEWHVCRSKTKGFPYWYNRKTGESRWLPPETNVESKSACVTAHETRLSKSSANANDRNYFRHDLRYFWHFCVLIFFTRTLKARETTQSASMRAQCNCCNFEADQ
jgi:hypothetical protein